MTPLQRVMERVMVRGGLGQNFVLRVILLAERSITETDILEVEGVIVQIEKMGARGRGAHTGGRGVDHPQFDPRPIDGQEPYAH